MDGGREYTVNQDSFGWSTNTYSYVSSGPGAPFLATTTAHWMMWTNFHNAKAVSIKWNGMDITDTTSNSVIVGQRVNLEAVVNPRAITTSNFTWSVDGSAISNYVVASDSSSAQVLPLTQTNKSMISFYWVGGGQQSVLCTVILTNGMKATGKAGFNVKRPNSNLSVFSLGIIACDAHVFIAGTPATGPYLHFGDGSTDSPGVLFTNVPDGSIAGTYQWVQIATNVFRSEQRNNGQVRNFLGKGLDFSYPLVTFRINSIADTPALGSPDSGPLDTNYVAATVQDTFDMYLMFNWNSSAASTDDGWVPLKKAHWGWSAAATRTGTNWSLTAGSAVVTGPSLSDTTNHPTWNGIAQSATWNP